MENPFATLNAVDLNSHLEVKKSGTTELKYVSWPYAWAEVKKRYPEAVYEVKKFNGLPYVYDPITGFMVYTSVTIEGVTHEMWLPVMDGANKSMKAVPYTYKAIRWEYNQQTRRREKVGVEERTVTALLVNFTFVCYYNNVKGKKVNAWQKRMPPKRFWNPIMMSFRTL